MLGERQAVIQNGRRQWQSGSKDVKSECRQWQVIYIEEQKVECKSVMQADGSAICYRQRQRRVFQAWRGPYMVL